ncbi:RIP metalloprotease RseP [Polluticaenibacter yanchengensis]|uniref:Zinc metalloprotease n=1 Tax=Polluticaenibacter yanchengensis TaxID=3014562 RepID=A0ABT4UM19_9BACT|nr:RIP metalloprotease RseP [Chitinophagaceae bacterium LY-5]
MLLFVASQWGLLIAQLMLSLSILVVVHEFGHFITAKWFGCRVEKFYLFFDPYFSLFKKKVGETEYGIGWLPLGGYVKISGMVDESMDKEQLNKPAESWEFRSKPAWQRLIIMLGGVIMNIITAFVIYMAICMVWGIKSVPNNSLKYGIAVQDSLMYDIGFKNGDKIKSVNDQPIEDFNKLPLKLILGDHAVVERDGKEETIALPENFIGQLVEKKRNRIPLATVRVEPLILFVSDSSGAKTAGMKVGDRIVAIDSTPIRFFDEIKTFVQPKKNDSVLVSYLRNGQQYSQSVLVSDEGQLGVLGAVTAHQCDSLGYAKLDTTKYGFFASIPAAAGLAKEKLSNQVAQLKKIFSPKTGGYKAVGGFKSMASIFNPYEWDWEDFWTMTAMLSILLAVMNLLPIPALDGGHVVFTLIEMITGRKPNQKILEYAQIAGMIILLALMLYANLNDFFGYGKGR